MSNPDVGVGGSKARQQRSHRVGQARERRARRIPLHGSEEAVQGDGPCSRRHRVRREQCLLAWRVQPEDAHLLHPAHQRGGLRSERAPRSARGSRPHRRRRSPARRAAFARRAVRQGGDAHSPVRGRRATAGRSSTATPSSRRIRRVPRSKVDRRPSLSAVAYSFASPRAKIDAT